MERGVWYLLEGYEDPDRRVRVLSLEFSGEYQRVCFWGAEGSGEGGGKWEFGRLWGEWFSLGKGGEGGTFNESDLFGFPS